MPIGSANINTLRCATIAAIVLQRALRERKPPPRPTSHGIAFTRKQIVSCFDLETCSKVIEDGAIGQNTHDFLLVFYSNIGRISYRFCATVDFMLR